MPRPDAPVPADELHEAMPRALARILRPETAEPSDEEVVDALRDRAARTAHDAAVLDVSAALVFGAEGRGLRPLVRKSCDDAFSIPLAGAVESLNVSVAAGVALFEGARQRSG